MINFVWSDMANTPQLHGFDDAHCDVTGHRKMSVLGTAGTTVTTHEKSIMIWSFKAPKLFCIL